MKKVYWIVSGEGEVGNFERVVTTELGIKQRLTRERCGGDRWARAYGDVYIAADGTVAGYDVESGETHTLPEDARNDAV